MPSWNGNARAESASASVRSSVREHGVRVSVQRLRLEQVCQPASVFLRVCGYATTCVCACEPVCECACWFSVKLVGFLRFVNIPPASCRCIRRLLLRRLSRGVQIIADRLRGKSISRLILVGVGACTQRKIIINIFIDLLFACRVIN